MFNGFSKSPAPSLPPESVFSPLSTSTYPSITTTPPSHHRNMTPTPTPTQHHASSTPSALLQKRPDTPTSVLSHNSTTGIAPSTPLHSSTSATASPAGTPVISSAQVTVAIGGLLRAWLTGFLGAVSGKVGMFFSKSLAIGSGGDGGLSGVDALSLISTYAHQNKTSTVSLVYLIPESSPSGDPFYFFPNGFQCAGRSAYEAPHGIHSFPAIYSFPNPAPMEHWPNVISILQSSNLLAPSFSNRYDGVEESRNTNPPSVTVSRRASVLSSTSRASRTARPGSSMSDREGIEVEDDSVVAAARAPSPSPSVTSSIGSTMTTGSGMTMTGMLGKLFLFGRREKNQDMTRKTSIITSTKVRKEGRVEPACFTPAWVTSRTVQFYDSKVDTTYTLSRVDPVTVVTIVTRGRKVGCLREGRRQLQIYRHYRLHRRR
ncbi:hypothetical protein BC829DRAFT_211373 [Chytridium lagenaria]|nr:hypothetical protein BC829DRAFT_211373 [Chytridium lagenaria]